MQSLAKAGKRLQFTNAVEKPRILIDHPQSMQDCSWRLSARALKPRHPYTLAASCKPSAKSRLFISHAHYISDDDGMIDVCQSHSVGGTYEGIEPMGLLWSLQASGLNNDALDPYQRHTTKVVFVKHDVTTPLDVALTLHEGHVSIDGDILFQPIQLQSKLSNACICILTPDAFSIREVDLEAQFSRLKVKVLFPPVLDLYGGGGGLVETSSRSACVTRLRNVCTALFCIRRSSPVSSKNIDIEYFIEAIDYLLALPNVNKHGVGILGLCFGGQMAMQVSLACKKVKVAVGISGFSYMPQFQNKLPGNNERQSSTLPWPFNSVKPGPKGVEYIDAFPPNKVSVAQIRFQIQLI
jgi:hypothetical protein